MVREFLSTTNNQFIKMIPPEKIDDIEKLMVVVQRIVDLKNNEGLDLLDKSEYNSQINNICKEFEHTAKQITNYLREKCKNPNIEKAISLYGPLLELQRKGARITIFSTNYDTTIENVCKKCEIGLIDGFKIKKGDEYPRFDPSSFQDGETKDDVLMFKLHGSVNWWSRDLRQDVFKLSLELDEKDVENLMIYPARKEDIFNFPYNILQSAFIYTLHDVDNLIAIGHRFRDPNIVSAVKAALERDEFRLTIVNLEADIIKKDVFGDHKRVVAIKKSVEEWIEEGIKSLTIRLNEDKESKRKSEEYDEWIIESLHEYPQTFWFGTFPSLSPGFSIHDVKLKCPLCGNQQKLETKSPSGRLLCESCKKIQQYTLKT